ncbi:hypothetical protein [Aeromonas phage phiWae14]|nr:hypothetical protein [Aeromonas phage phiWae14]
MADLKLGSQIGGNLIWHQGILELNPVDDKLFYRDQEIMTTRGNQTLLGTTNFDIGGTNYDLISMPSQPTNSKSYLRKFRGGEADIIWHETVQGSVYKISTGNTDSALMMQLATTGALFQYPVLTNAAQSSAANSLVRKDYADAIDAKNVAKAGDTMTGDLLFNSVARKIRVNEIASITSGWDAAGNSTFFKLGAYDQAKGGDLLEIRAAGAGVGNRTSGFDVRTMKNISNTPLYVGDNMVYHPGNKPTPGDLDAYTKSEVDEKNWIRVKDERAAMIPPSGLADKTISAYFTNKSDVSSSWVSGFTVNGWTASYAAWSLFAGARSDVDENKLWFKHGRSDWLKSSRIYHEDDKPTNVELNLVSRAGDEMVGALNMKVADTMGFGKYSIKLNNGSIGGINQLVFGDPSDTTSEGIAWPKTGKNDSATTNAEYDLLWALDGDLKFNNKSTYGEWNKPNHNDVGAPQRIKSSATGTAISYTRLCSMKAAIGSSGNGANFLLTGGNNFGNNSVPMYNISFNTQTYSGTGVHPEHMIRITLLQEGISECKFYAITVGTEVELWVQRPTYSGEMTITILNDWGLTVHMNTVATLPIEDKTEIDVARVYTSMQKPSNVDLNLVSRAGDKMTGALEISMPYPQIIFTESDQNDKKYIMIADGKGIRLNEDTTGGKGIWQYFPHEDKLTLYKPCTGEMGNLPSSLTTKDYVDTKVGTAVQSVTATGAVKSTGGINPVISLVNATTTEDGAMSAADKAKLNGLPAAAVNKTGDSMTGSLTFTNDSQLVWSRNTDWAKIGFKNDSDQDTDSYMWFETGDNGNEYFKFRVKPTGSTTSEDVFLIKRNETRSNGRFFVDPSTQGSDLITLIGTPNPTGTNARGISGYESTGTTRDWGVGAFSENGEFKFTYLGEGATPWINGLKIHKSGVIETNKSIHLKADNANIILENITDDATKYPSIKYRHMGGQNIEITPNVHDNIRPPFGWHFKKSNDNPSTTLNAYIDVEGTVYAGDDVIAGGDIVAKGNVNVTGHITVFADKATGKTSGETGITTARFVQMLTEKGAFKTVYWVSKVSWDYAGNNVITDTGFGNIHLAGCVIEVIGGTSQYTIRVTTPTTTGTALGAVASREYIYTNHGPTYAPGWRRSINSEDVNLSQTGSWAGTINSIPYIGSDGVMEVAKYIDFHDTNSTADYNVRLENQGDSLWVRTQHGGMQLGAQNTSYAHIYTDRPVFYMNKELQINGARVMFEGSTHGTLTLSNWIRTTGNTGWFNATYNGGIHMEDSTWVRTYNGKKFYCSNAEGDAIYTAGGIKAEGNGNFNDVYIRSDERLKSNFKPILNALDKVGYLSGITYDKVGKTTREAGIIAQRLKVVLPEATGTVTSNDIDYLTVSNSGVNALLIEAIKELTERVKYLESKLN